MYAGVDYSQGYGRVFKQTTFCAPNRGLIILIQTGDRNGSHVRSNVAIDLFIVARKVA